MTNEQAFLDVHARFLAASPAAMTGPEWLKATTAIAKDVIMRALGRLRSEGLPVGIYFALTDPCAANQDSGWREALGLITLKYVNSCGRGRVHASYPKCGVQQALVAPERNFPIDEGYPARESYSIDELGTFCSIEHVEPIGLFLRAKPHLMEAPAPL